MNSLGRLGTWRSFTPADGLAALRVAHIAEDHERSLWFATTTNGVSRFDGGDFETFTRREGLSGDEVTMILAARDGRLWFGCNGGVCFYDGTGFRPLAADVWGPDVNILHLAEDRDGRVWFAGISRAPDRRSVIGFHDRRGLHDLSQEYRRDCGELDGLCWGIAEDDEGRIWFARTRLVCYDGSRFAAYGPEHGLPPASLNSLGRPMDGGPLWVGGSKVLGRFDGRMWEASDDPIAGYVRRISADSRGRMWVSDSEGGALCCDGDLVERFDDPDIFGHYAVPCVHLHSEGHLWFAPQNATLSVSNPRVLKRAVRSYPPKRKKHDHWPQPTTLPADAVMVVK